MDLDSALDQLVTPLRSKEASQPDLSTIKQSSSLQKKASMDAIDEKEEENSLEVKQVIVPQQPNIDLFTFEKEVQEKYKKDAPQSSSDNVSDHISLRSSEIAYDIKKANQTELDQTVEIKTQAKMERILPSV